MANSITLINKGETVKYAGKFKGWKHQVSEYHIVLRRNDKTVESIPTGKNASASFISHLNAALAGRLAFRDVKIATVEGVTIYKTLVKVAGFGGEHICGYVAKQGKTSYHMDKAEYNQAKRFSNGLNLNEQEKAERLAGLLAEKNKKMEEAKALKQAEAEEVKAGLKFTAQSIHEKFGFCLVGITEFAEACGLNPTAAYTCQQILNAYRSADDCFVFNKYEDEISLFVKFCKRTNAA